MLKVFARGVVASIGLAVALVPSVSDACCFTNCFKRQTTYAAPCQVCPQQVSYVPQTCYRTEYTCVPCTSYKPVTTCDPCTGCPQTVMQPVTTYVRRPVQVPYTTYRPVVTAVNYAPSPCSTCSGAAYYSPTYSATSAAVATPGCSTCGPASAAYAAPAASYAAPTYSVPAASAPYSAPNYSAPTYTNPSTPAYGQPQPYMQQPSLNGPTPAMQPNGGSAPQTFQPSQPQDNSSLRPIEPPANPQETESNTNSSMTPRLLDPQNRTTARPMLGPASVMPAIFKFKSSKRPIFLPASIKAPATDDGWKPMGSR